MGDPLGSEGHDSPFFHPVPIEYKKMLIFGDESTRIQNADPRLIS